MSGGTKVAGGVLFLTVLAVLAAFVSGCARPKESSVSPRPSPPPGPAATGTSGPSAGAAASGKTVIQAKGSDTLLQVSQALAEAYKAEHPDVEVSVTGGGSGTGFQALIEGTCDIANASRKIKPEEESAARAKGVEPVEHLIGYDGIAVIVNKENPISKITIDQLSDIYVGTITDWKALGGSGEIVLLSRDSTSGTYEYFKEHVVQKGDKKSDRDYAAGAIMLQSNDQIRSQVASTKGAIGYIGLGYLDDSVKALPVVGKDGKPVSPSVESVRDGSYPISRPLFMYTKKGVAEAVSAFLEWVKSPAGQEIVKREGFVPLS